MILQFTEYKSLPAITLKIFLPLLLLFFSNYGKHCSAVDLSGFIVSAGEKEEQIKDFHNPDINRSILNQMFENPEAVLKDYQLIDCLISLAENCQQMTEAHLFFKNLRKQQPDSLQILYGYCYTLERLNRDEEALEILSPYLKDELEYHPWLNMLMGVLLFFKNDLDSAYRHLELGYVKNPQMKKNLLYLAAIDYARGDDLNRVEQRLNDVLDSIEPFEKREKYLVLRFLGLIYNDREEIDRAFDYYQQAATYSPRQAYSDLKLDLLCHQAERYGDAQKFLKTALEHYQPDEFEYQIIELLSRFYLNDHLIGLSQFNLLNLDADLNSYLFLTSNYSPDWNFDYNELVREGLPEELKQLTQADDLVISSLIMTNSAPSVITVNQNSQHYHLLMNNRSRALKALNDHGGIFLSQHNATFADSNTNEQISAEVGLYYAIIRRNHLFLHLFDQQQQTLFEGTVMLENPRDGFYLIQLEDQSFPAIVSIGLNNDQIRIYSFNAEKYRYEKSFEFPQLSRGELF